MKTRLMITQNTLLLVAGGLLLLIGAFITLSPVEFYASYSIEIGDNVNLLNELKAPAGFLLAAGLFMLGAVLWRSLAEPALWLVTLIYLSYAIARLLSFAVDGVPAKGLVAAGILEAIVGLLSLSILLLGYRKESSAQRVNGPRG